MKKAICAGLRQAIFSRGFIISAAGTALILLLSSVQGILAGFRSAELLSPGYHSDLIVGALSSEAMALALPILAALPYTASFIDDVKSGFIKEYLPRTTVPRYIAGKAVGCAVSGGLGAGAWHIGGIRLRRAHVPANGSLPQGGRKRAELLWQSNGDCAHVLCLGGFLVADGHDLRRAYQQQIYGIRLALRAVLSAHNPIRAVLR